MRWARDWATSKTTWAGIAAILGAVASCLAGKESFGQAEQQAVVAALGIFLRDAVVKTGEAPSG
jgi:hypothetical protein